jgi:hypothetical protein
VTLSPEHAIGNVWAASLAPLDPDLRALIGDHAST